MFSQNNDDFINTSSWESNGMTYAIGEIFVVNKIKHKETPQSSLLTALISPNPVVHSTTIEIYGTLEDQRIYIYDLMGRIVLMKSLKTQLLDLSSLNSGVYFLKSASNEFSPIQFIKN